MKSSEINWRGGRVAYWDLDSLDPRKDIRLQVDDLKQDLVQVYYDGKHGEVIVDVGWYPDFSKEGSFRIRVIEQKAGEYDWRNPMFEAKAWSFDELVKGLNMAVMVALKVARSKGAR